MCQKPAGRTFWSQNVKMDEADGLGGESRVRFGSGAVTAGGIPAWSRPRRRSLRPLRGSGHSGRLGKSLAAFHNAVPVGRHQLIRAFACAGLGSLGKLCSRRGWQRAARVWGHRSAGRSDTRDGSASPARSSRAPGGFGASWEHRQGAHRPTSRLHATSLGLAGGAPRG